MFSPNATRSVAPHCGTTLRVVIPTRSGRGLPFQNLHQVGRPGRNRPRRRQPNLQETIGTSRRTAAWTSSIRFSDFSFVTPGVGAGRRDARSVAWHSKRSFRRRRRSVRAQQPDEQPEQVCGSSGQIRRSGWKKPLMSATTGWNPCARSSYRVERPPPRGAIWPGPFAVGPIRTSSRWPATKRSIRKSVIYLNRLSDLLFVLARTLNRNGQDDVLWQPGKNREATS